MGPERETREGVRGQLKEERERRGRTRREGGREQ